MLRSAFDRAHRERRLSIRMLAKQLDYKQATVLSHMASGRVAIPLERAPDIARAVGIPPSIFLAAAVAQRLPKEDHLLLVEQDSATLSQGLAADLQVIAGVELDRLSDEHKAILKEVVSDAHPQRRWLSVAEVPIVTLIRRHRPQFSQDGISEKDRSAIETVLS